MRLQPEDHDHIPQEMKGLISILTVLVLSYIPSTVLSSPESLVTLPDFSFVTAGDFGCKDEAKRTVINMISNKPDFMIALGDLSYERNATCWLGIVSPLDTPGKIRIAIGDHDIDPDLSRYNQYLRHFNLTEPYYSFDYQNVYQSR
jgi:hypothetical protein